MIITVDGVKKKRYDRAWEVSRDADTWELRPTLSKLNGTESQSHGYWHSYDLCLEECMRQMNEGNVDNMHQYMCNPNP